jgi:hypothetical protein
MYGEWRRNPTRVLNLCVRWRWPASNPRRFISKGKKIKVIWKCFNDHSTWEFCLLILALVYYFLPLLLILIHLFLVRYELYQISKYFYGLRFATLQGIFAKHQFSWLYAHLLQEIRMLEHYETDCVNYVRLYIHPQSICSIFKRMHYHVH